MKKAKFEEGKLNCLISAKIFEFLKRRVSQHFIELESKNKMIAKNKCNSSGNFLRNTAWFFV